MSVCDFSLTTPASLQCITSCSKNVAKGRNILNNDNVLCGAFSMSDQRGGGGGGGRDSERYVVT